MRDSRSTLNPPITLITMISVATPSAMPTSEKIGDDRDEAFAAAGAQIAAGDRALERLNIDVLELGLDASERVSADSSLRSPVARRFSSTVPAAAPRGPTTICHG